MLKRVGFLESGSGSPLETIFLARRILVKRLQALEVLGAAVSY